MTTTYNDLNKHYGQTGKQLGQYLIYISSNAAKEKLHGYKITSFDGFEPNQCKFLTTKDMPKGNTSWSTAYDLLFGAPTGKPDFISAIN